MNMYNIFSCRNYIPQQYNVFQYQLIYNNNNKNNNKFIMNNLSRAQKLNNNFDDFGVKAF